MKRAEVWLAAGKEYYRKTTGPHQMWATRLDEIKNVHLELGLGSVSGLALPSQTGAHYERPLLSKAGAFDFC